MTLITISRQLGSGGDAIAAEVASHLGLRLVDRETVHALALAAGVPEDLLVRLMYEGQRILAAEILDSLATPMTPAAARSAQASPLVGAFAPVLPGRTVSIEDAAQAVGRVLQDLARQDNVLILGQGGQMWLAGWPGVCHVQVVAPMAERVRRLVQRDKGSPSAARRRLRASDQARADYLARYHSVNWLDPLLYHLIINTGQVPLDVGAVLVEQAAREMAAQ
jgi:cytidylate kinase